MKNLLLLLIILLLNITTVICAGTNKTQLVPNHLLFTSGVIIQDTLPPKAQQDTLTSETLPSVENYASYIRSNYDNDMGTINIYGAKTVYMNQVKPMSGKYSALRKLSDDQIAIGLEKVRGRPFPNDNLVPGTEQGAPLVDNKRIWNSILLAGASLKTPPSRMSRTWWGYTTPKADH